MNEICCYIWFLIGLNEVFLYFIWYKNYVFDVEEISFFLVGFVIECVLRCIIYVLCLLFNIKEGNIENSR